VEVTLDRSGRVAVRSDCSVAGHDHVFVIGDLARMTDAAGRDVPGLAPAAIQQGEYVAKVIRARLAGKSAPAPFRYKDLGTMAVIGMNRAVGDLRFLQVTGWFAWFMWAFVHILALIDGAQRLRVFVLWTWKYFTRKIGDRLVTGLAELANPPQDSRQTMIGDSRLPLRRHPRIHGIDERVRQERERPTPNRKNQRPVRFLIIPAGAHPLDAHSVQVLERFHEGRLPVVEHVVVPQRDDVHVQALQHMECVRVSAKRDMRILTWTRTTARRHGILEICTDDVVSSQNLVHQALCEIVRRFSEVPPDVAREHDVADRRELHDWFHQAFNARGR
jgi:hypothetical protein